jgi:hypothetical protein
LWAEGAGGLLLLPRGKGWGTSLSKAGVADGGFAESSAGYMFHVASADNLRPSTCKTDDQFSRVVQRLAQCLCNFCSTVQKEELCLFMYILVLHSGIQKQTTPINYASSSHSHGLTD